MLKEESQGQPQQSERKSAGQILKETRKSRGIALDTVHAATKIPLDALKGIEEGYAIRSLSSFYLKGFIKMYAQYLGVEVSDVIIEDYKPEQLPKPAVLVSSKLTPIEISEYKSGGLSSRQGQRLIVIIAGVIFFLFVATKITGCVRHRAAGRAPKPAAVTKISKLKSKETVRRVTAPKEVPGKNTIAKVYPAAEIKKADKPVVAVAPRLPEVKPVFEAAAARAVVPRGSPTPKSPEPVLDKSVHLTIKAKKQGWLQVKVDGNLVLQSTIKEGAVETWDAKEKVEISGKDIHNLEFELNGKVLGTLGRGDRSARRVMITRQGLEVVK